MTLEEENEDLKMCIKELLQCIRAEDWPMVVEHAKSALGSEFRPWHIGEEKI